MILIWVVALFGACAYAGEGAISGEYREYGDLSDNLKKISDVKYVEIDNDKRDGEKYGEEYKGYELKDVGYGNLDEKNRYDEKDRFGDRGRDEDKGRYDKKDRYDEKDRFEENKRYDDKNDDNENDYRYYGDYKFEKFDGPTDYLITDKDDRRYSGRKYYGNKGSDLDEYDYMPKCDYNIKDCKDGRDCYDKAKDRSGYDTCRDTYGREDRYYDEQDRYNSDRYRYDDERSRYGYEKDCYDNSKGREEYDRCRQYYKKCSEYRNDYKYSYNEQDWKNNYDCYDNNLVGVGRNDREDQLIRPCALDDWQCIRKYFAENSNCKPAFGPIPDPLYLKRNTVYLPFANITLIITRMRVTGLSSIKIREFYVNKDTKNLVIAFDFRNLNETAPRTYFRYKRTAKESIVLSDYGTLEYFSGTFTAVIPRIPHLRLDLAEVHADFDDQIPRYFIGPKAFASDDPNVIASFARLNSNIPVATQEYFLLQSQLFTAIYIQENICDFGLKLISI